MPDQTTDLVKRLRATDDDWPSALVQLGREAADEIERLRIVEENAKAMRDVAASIADAPGKEQTMRAALRLLVRAFDEGIKHA